MNKGSKCTRFLYTIPVTIKFRDAKKIWIAIFGLLIFLVPLTYLVAKNFSLKEQIEKLRSKYPYYTEDEIAVVEVVKNASPSVVSIIVRKEVFGAVPQVFDLGNGFQILIPGELQSQGKKIVGQGTGFVVTQDGLLATNQHVVSDPKADYEVIFNNGKKFPASIFMTDDENDLALLKVSQVPKKAKPLSLADSSKLKIGQTVIAIGNSLGELQNTVTKGVISALNRSIVAQDSSGKTEKLNKVIQTDAAINSGNSGGPLLNTVGEVIGVNAAVNKGAENIGFAIPADRLKDLLFKL